MSIQCSSKKITKTVPVSVTCDVCGKVHQFSDDDILYHKEIQGFGTLTYVGEAGFGQKKFEKHFCSYNCLKKLLCGVCYDCNLYLPRPLIDDLKNYADYD